MTTCGYGRTFEPDLNALGLPIHRGIQEGLRTITIGVTNLLKQDHIAAGGDLVNRATPNSEPENVTASNVHPRYLEVRILQIGNSSFALTQPLIKLMEKLCLQSGLGPEHVRAKVLQDTFFERRLTLTPDQHLSLSPTPSLSSSRVAKITILLKSPLLLKRRQKKRDGLYPRKRAYQASDHDFPTFSQLVRESLRTVRRAINELADPEWGRNLEVQSFLAQCEAVQMDSHELKRFQQDRTSARQQRAWQITGWTGSMSFAEVPLQALPLLQWAGILGIGDSRNCGAGLWEILLN